MARFPAFRRAAGADRHHGAFSVRGVIWANSQPTTSTSKTTSRPFDGSPFEHLYRACLSTEPRSHGPRKPPSSKKRRPSYIEWSKGGHGARKHPPPQADAFSQARFPYLAARARMRGSARAPHAPCGDVVPPKIRATHPPLLETRFKLISTSVRPLVPASVPCSCVMPPPRQPRHSPPVAESGRFSSLAPPLPHAHMSGSA